MHSIETLFPQLSLIPVVVIDHAEAAVPLARALLEGGIGSIEITLRTEAGIQAIEAVAQQVPEIIVGAGTVTTAEQMHEAQQAGAQFQVSPGITETLADQAQSCDIAWLPGTSDASSVMLAREHHFHALKLFPASLAGGAPMLKQFASVFPDCRFCPTGGISLNNLQDYSILPNVFAIGGSWLTPKEAIASKDWHSITALAKEATKALAAHRS